MRDADKKISVWRFEDAPEEYRKLSNNGGDEDWVAFVPDSFGDRWIGWLDEGSSFGCCSVNQYKVNGGTIHIGCHA